MEENQGRSKVGIIFAIMFFIILIIGIIWVGLYIAELSKKEPIESYDEIKLIARDEQGNSIPANYELKQVFKVVDKGILTPEAKETFIGGNYSDNYTLYAWGNNFYLNSAPCYNASECSVTLKKHSNPIFRFTNITNNISRLTIYNADGIIKMPIICVAHTVDYKDFNLTMTKVTRPKRLKNDVDECFSFNRSIGYGYEEVEVRFSTRDINLESSFTEYFLVDLGFDSDLKETYEFDNEIPDKKIRVVKR